MRYRCRWCSDQYDDLGQMFGHAAWSHRDELVASITSPPLSDRSTGIVTCPQCQRRGLRIEEGRSAGLRPSEVFAVSTYACIKLGHSFYFSTFGEIPLCSARSLRTLSV